jgi:hypothetical protein
MTVYNLGHISAFSVLLPLAIVIWKWHAIWRKFSLLVVYLLIGGISDLISYVSIKSHGNNTVNSNVYQLAEFVLLVWLFKRWPSIRKGYFHNTILIIGIVLWMLDYCIINSIFQYSSMFRVSGSILLVFVCVDQINFSILNRDNSVIVSRMLVKIGFVTYFFYKAFIESFDLFDSHILYPYSVQFWYIQCSLSILLNVLIAIAFLCYRSKPTHSILT